MQGSCDGRLLLVGPVFAAVGGFMVALALAAWLRPQSRFVRTALQPYRIPSSADPPSRRLDPARELGTMMLAFTRVVSPIIGTAFVAVGCYVTFLTLHCRTALGH